MNEEKEKYKRQMSLVAREQVKKRLWNYGFRVRVCNYPVDLETSEGYRIIVARKNPNSYIIKLDEEKMKYADLIAVVSPTFGVGVSQQILFASASVYWHFYKEENFGGIKMTKKISNVFRRNPKELMTSKPKKRRLPPVKLINSEWYTIKTISANRLLNKQYSSNEIRKMISTGILKAVALGSKKTGKRYWIKGEWIIRTLGALDKN